MQVCDKIPTGKTVGLNAHAQAVTGVLSRGNILSLFNMYKNCNTYQ